MNDSLNTELKKDLNEALGGASQRTNQRRLIVPVVIFTFGLVVGLGIWLWPTDADAPPDREETEEMMREIGYVQ